MTDVRAPEVTAPEPELAGWPVHRRKSRAEWVFGAILALFAAMFLHNLLTNERWHFPVIGQYLFDPLVLEGLRSTIFLTLLTGVSGVAFGVLVALARLSKSRLLRAVATAYVGFIRAIPALVLLLLLYFVGALIPTVSLGIPFGPDFGTTSVNDLISQFTAAWLGLTMIVGAHSGEIIRGGILSVHKGQIEAARALGMSPSLTFRRVVFPQAIRVAIPGLANELVSLFKNTSLVTIIGYGELLTSVQHIYSRTYETIPLLLVAFIWYLVLTVCAMFLQGRLERRYGKAYRAVRT